jgi:hypothetical protein
MCILKLLSVIFYRCLLYPFDLHEGYISLNDISVGKSRILKSTTITVLGIPVFKSSSVCFIKLSALTFSAYMIMIVTSSRLDDSLYSYEVTFFFFSG